MREELFELDRLREKARRLEDRLAELDAMKISIPSGLSHGTGKSSGEPGAAFEKFVADHDEVFRELIEVKTQWLDLRIAVNAKIDRLSDFRYQNALFYRFVLGYSAAETAKQCGFQSKWIFKILKQAVAEYDKL